MPDDESEQIENAPPLPSSPAAVGDGKSDVVDDAVLAADIRGNSDGGSVAGELDSGLSAPRPADDGSVGGEQVEAAVQSPDLIDFSTKRAEIVNARKQDIKPIVATRGKKSISTRGNNEVATRGKGRKKADAGWRVDAVKASKNTWAFRLRWYENGERGTPDYVTRVSDSIYKIIRKGNYEAFKADLIANHSAGTVSARHGS